MTYYTRALPSPAASLCCLCGQSSAGLWCDRCLEPLRAAGDDYNARPGANVITVRRAPTHDVVSHSKPVGGKHEPAHKTF